MRLSLTAAVTAVALAGALVAPATGLAAKSHPKRLAGLSRSAAHAPRHHRQARLGHQRPLAHVSSFYNGVSTYCYGRFVSNGGGGSVEVDLNRSASFGFAPGTYIRWRPWLQWSNARGSGWFTPYTGYFGYNVAYSGATGSGTIVNGSTVIGGTDAPGVSTTTWLGVAANTSARAYLELIINGRSYLDPLTPDHGDWPATRSGDWCNFA